VFIRSDRNEALIVVRLSDWIELKTKGKPDVKEAGT
jgi:hypothetical protein